MSRWGRSVPVLGDRDIWDEMGTPRRTGTPGTWEMGQGHPRDGDDMGNGTRTSMGWGRQGWDWDTQKDGDGDTGEWGAGTAMGWGHQGWDGDTGDIRDGMEAPMGQVALGDMVGWDTDIGAGPGPPMGMLGHWGHPGWCWVTLVGGPETGAGGVGQQGCDTNQYEPRRDQYDTLGISMSP